MNANELAKELLDIDGGWDEGGVMQQAATMLRQQQAEIEALKCGNEATAKLNYQKGFEFGSSLTTYNKPAMEKLQAEIEALKNFAIWMTGCGYDFCQHEYFIKCRDELLVGKVQEK